MLITFHEAFLTREGTLERRERKANSMLDMLKEIVFQAQHTHQRIGVAVPHMASKEDEIRFVNDSLRLDGGSGEAGIDKPFGYTGTRLKSCD